MMDVNNAPYSFCTGMKSESVSLQMDGGVCELCLDVIRTMLSLATSDARVDSPYDQIHDTK
ncbi:hypothetical protein DPMN_129236 [Dreissena polymorpha]|uniref:Uncharacterized protein n=1 Tax=Dreissena polymorpha TaxID=45954 RepID=A0A9D4H2D4_DREPO|nr:hypothetical protein DPMN_129236 [Dreissena polymorpha]